MNSAVLSRLVTFGLICLAAGYVVVANTSPATSTAAIRRDYALPIVQTPLTAQPPLHTVEINPAPPTSLVTTAPAVVNPVNAKSENDLPHGPHDDLIAMLAKPEVEVLRPRSPFLEALPRISEPETAVKAAPKAKARVNSPTKTKRAKSRRIRSTNPFANLWQPKFRAFEGDNPFRSANQGVFGPRSSKRRTATTSSY